MLWADLLQTKQIPLNRLLFLILVDLLFFNSKLRGSRRLRSLSSYTRLMGLTQTNTEDCHVCLLEKVGVEDISLAASIQIRLFIWSEVATRLSIYFLCNETSVGIFVSFKLTSKSFPHTNQFYCKTMYSSILSLSFHCIWTMSYRMGHAILT